MRLADRILAKDYQIGGRPEPPYRDSTVSRSKLASILMDEFGIEVGDDSDRGMSDEARSILEQRRDDVMAALHRARAEEREALEKWTAANKEVRDGFVELLNLATIVCADNVYRYCRNAPPFDMYDLPCLAPKWPSVFVEWTQDNGQHIGVFGLIQDGPFRPDERIPEAIAGALGEGGLHRTKNGLFLSDNMPDQHAWDQVRWIWKTDIFVGHPKSGTVGPLFGWALLLDERGRLLDATWQSHAPELPTEQVRDDGATIIKIFGQTLAFLNCRNVGTIWYDPPEKLQRKHLRKRKAEHPLVRYHVIKIDPKGDKGARSVGTSNEANMAVHIVSGAFHHYGDCCPGSHEAKGLLFGKHTGVYWHPMHARGNPQHGAVAADYEVGRVDA